MFLGGGGYGDDDDVMWLSCPSCRCPQLMALGSEEGVGLAEDGFERRWNKLEGSIRDGRANGEATGDRARVATHKAAKREYPPAVCHSLSGSCGLAIRDGRFGGVGQQSLGLAVSVGGLCC